MPRKSLSTVRPAPSPLPLAERPKGRARPRQRKGNSHTELTRRELEQMLLARVHERPKR